MERKQATGKLKIRGGERQFILLLGDLVVSSLSVFISLYFWAQKDWLDFSWSFVNQRAPFWFYLLPIIWSLMLIELYDTRKANRHSEVLRGVGTSAGFSVVIYLLIFFLAQTNSLPRRGVAVFLISVTLLTIVWRFIYIAIFSAPVFNRRVLVIGAGRAGSTLVGMVKRIKPEPFELVGYIDDDPQKQNQVIEGVPVIGTTETLLNLIEKEKISDMIFAISGELKPDLFRAVLLAQEEGTDLISMPTIYEDVFGRVPIFLLQSDWILRSFIDQAQTSGIYEVIKRILDLISGLIGIIFLVVLYPLVALTILVDDGFPIIYSQMRVGKNGKPYKIYKFRTMRKDAESDGVARMTTTDDSDYFWGWSARLAVSST